METTKIRDTLLEKRALYQQSMQQAEQEAKKFSEIVNSISDEIQMELKSILGSNYVDLSSFDISRMQTDSEYFNSCKEKLNTMILELHKYLEAELNA